MRDQMERGLKALVGEDIHAAIGLIGNPESQRTTVGDKAYVWSRENADAAATGQRTHVVHLSCKIELLADSNGTIRSYQWKGDYDGCRRWAVALDHG